jgi:DNA invertase Pin-like site-specific DNA recombinase
LTETHPQNRHFGYARVSTYGQTLDTQLEQLRGAGCTKIFREKVTARTMTGASFSECLPPSRPVTL